MYVSIALLFLQVSCALTSSTEVRREFVPSAKKQEISVDITSWWLDYLRTKQLAVQAQELLLKQSNTPPKPDSLAEAMLTVAVLNRAVSSRVTVQEVASQFNFDFLQALQSNPFLNYPQFLLFVSSTVSAQVGDEKFHQTLEEILRLKLKGYRDTLDEIDARLTMPTAQVATIQAIDSDLFRTGDYLILEADALASHGKYQEALAILTSIDRHSPLVQIAQEKRIEISNRAVQDLRKKAALSFQKAGPISDRRTREAYLQEAHNYLKQALTLYPQAENLNVVKDNLTTIARDLRKLGVRP